MTIMAEPYSCVRSPDARAHGHGSAGTRRGRAPDVIYNGFLPYVRAPSFACHADFGFPDDAPIVGTISRFAPEKNLGRWLETASAIAAARSDVNFVMAGYGHGTSADDIADAFRRLGLAHRFAMPGAVVDVGPIYAAMDVFLLSSSTESLGNVLIEAQAAGVPVVAPDVGGIREAMLDGVTGVLVAEPSPVAFADAVLRILGDADWRSRATARGPEFIAHRFGFDRMVHEMLAAFC
jgi:glycosyltransferase involved in cell wall biosynthesis